MKGKVGYGAVFRRRIDSYGAVEHAPYNLVQKRFDAC